MSGALASGPTRLDWFLTVTLYNRSNAGDQYATVCVSVGSVFAVFCLILLYHCLKKLGLFTVICKRNPARAPLLEEVDNRESDSDDEMLNLIDKGRISDPMIQTPPSLTIQTHTSDRALYPALFVLHS